MKTLKSIFIISLATLFSISCDDQETLADKVMAETNLEGGALRTIQEVNLDIAVGNNAAKFEVVLEVQDKPTMPTSKIQVYARFLDNTTANGTNPRTELLMKEIPASEFYAGTRGLPFARVSLTITELLTKLNLTIPQYTGGDRFVVRLAQVLNNGRVLTNTDANAAILGGGYFKSPYLYNANVVCPITENLAGTHSYVSTNMKRGPGGTVCGGTVSGTVTWVTVTPGVFTNSDYSFGQFGACWGDSPATGPNMRITWFCKNLIASGPDQYGDSYTFTITAVSGSQLTLNWVNTYGDSGTTVITRAGGANWPTILAP
jgi:hypothetical protein